MGSTHDILWSASDDILVTNIALYYSTDGGSGWIPIDEDEPNDGVFPWTIPSTPSILCQVKVVAFDADDSTGEDTSDSNFTIEDCQAPTVDLTSPVGGESWCVGSSHDILWSASDDVGVTNIALYYSTDGGSAWIPIDEDELNDGIYPWVIPTTPSALCRVKVIAYDEASNAGEDTSDSDFTIEDCQSPTVDLTSPVGAESWCVGSSHDILWSASDDVGVTNIALYYSTDGGSGWIPIDEDEPNDGVYPWVIPPTPSTQCRVRVIAYDEATNAAEDTSGSNFTIEDCQAPTVDLTSPVGGESWCIGSTHDILWSASDEIGVTNIALYYSTDGGSGWIPIDEDESNDGVYPWVIPTTPSALCRVKVIAYDEASNAAEDTSDSDFTIGDCQAPVVDVTAPVGGESWCVGSTHDILWSASDDIGVTNIALYYSTDGGSGWIPIDEDEPNDGVFPWVIPATPSTQCRVRVIAYDEAANAGEDTSDSDFTIEDCQAPTVDLTSPVGAESWCAGSTHDILWSASDDVGVTNIALYYSTDGGSGWIPIDEDEPNDGVYPWFIPSTPSTQCRVRIIAYDEATNATEDTSDSNFTIEDCQAPTVDLTSPVGGEGWCIGTSNDILWSASDDVGVTNIALHYSTDGGSGWIPIDESEPNDGVYTWLIPNAPSSQCRVKVTAYDQADLAGVGISDSNFAILDCEAPAVEITSPAGGESWCIGGSYDILWSASDEVGVSSISLYYSVVGGSEWILIDQDEPNDGVYSWIIPNTPSAECWIEVKAYDEAGNIGADISDGSFAIEECQAPVVEVISPVGGESWCIGSSYDILWSASDDFGVTNIALYYSTDGGTGWIPIDEEEPNDGVYSWLVPSTPSTQCRVKVMAYDEANNIGEDMSDSNFTIRDCQAPTVSVIDPNGGESWWAGSSHDILWSASDNVGVTNIALYYSTDGGSGWIPIDEEEPNDGVYAWIIPHTPSASCRVKVVASDEADNTGEDKSDGDFTIQESQSPIVSVIAPVGGETWCIGNSYDILWSASDNIEVTNIALYYSTDGGSGWIPIDEEEPNDGVYPWVVPDTASASCRVKIVASDEASNTGEDTSDSNFVITQCQAPVVSVISPEGGEDWCIGSSHDILWSASDDAGVTNIALYYSTNGGSGWVPIDLDEPNDGVFPWTIPNTPSTQCRVKVIAYDEDYSTGEDISDGNFIIRDCQPPTVSVIDPDGGENWCTGSSHEVLWSASDNLGVTKIVSLYYSTDGGSGWIPIDENEFNDGAYDWVIPHTPSDQCRVKVRAYDEAGNVGEDISDSNFIICEANDVDHWTDDPNAPVGFALFQSHPNPFNPSCRIPYVLATGCLVRLEVYNMLGQRVRTLVAEYQTVGHKIVHWDATDDQGNSLPAGLYFYRIRAGEFADSKKMVILK